MCSSHRFTQLLQHGLISPTVILVKGWTTWFERVLQGALHGPAERDFSYIIGRKALTDALEQFKDRPKYQRLVIPFEVSEGSRCAPRIEAFSGKDPMNA